jgi:hypothetical protein
MQKVEKLYLVGISDFCLRKGKPADMAHDGLLPDNAWHSDEGRRVP